jgi:Ala-tRNA(Pro) deacylase
MGEACRYDGKAYPLDQAIEELKNIETIKICPEIMAGLPTPRMPMEIVCEGKEQKVFSEDGKEYTSQFIDGAQKTLKLCKEHNVRYAILKDKSPSCGSQEIYNGNFEGVLIPGMGITAHLLGEHDIQVFSAETAPYKKIKVYDYLEQHGISYIKHEHEPVFTVEQASEMDVNIEAQQCKNLFLRNKKGDRHFLVILEHHRHFDLKQFGEENGLGRLSFASSKRLKKYLGVEPGSVSAFALINDGNHHVEVYIDRDFNSEQNISFHPNQNDETLEITYQDFEKFIKSCGYTYQKC